MVDFSCLDDECKAAVSFNLMEVQEGAGHMVCAQCRRAYHLDAVFLGKLQRLRKLILTVQESADLLGAVNVAVTTPQGEVKIPYWLMLTRLNTVITLDLGGQMVDFNFRIEPLNQQTFR